MKYLGIDFGLKRVGLATSDGELTSPLQTIEVKGFKDAISQVSKIIKKGEFEKIIVGLPEGKMGQVVLGFIKALKKQGLDVIEADETLSSQKAIAQMIELNIPKNKRQTNDAMAAAIILQDYIESVLIGEKI